MDWNFSATTVDSANGVVNLGTTPTVSFNNVNLNLGDFAEKFIVPVIDKIAPILEPIDKIIDIINQDIRPLYIFGDDVVKRLDVLGATRNGAPAGDGKITILDLAQFARPDLDLSGTVNFINAVDKIVGISQAIHTLYLNSELQPWRLHPRRRHPAWLL